MQIRINRNRSLAIALGLVLACVLGATSCAKNSAPHPNQISPFDGATYDTLMEAQASLDQAKIDYAAGKYAAIPNAKTIINGAGASYNIAYQGWETWRDIVLGVKAGDAATAQAQLQTDMNNLAAAIANVVKMAKGGK